MAYVIDRLYGPSKKVWMLVPELKPGMKIVLDQKTHDDALGLANSAIMQDIRNKVGAKNTRPHTPVEFMRTGTPLRNDYPTIWVKGNAGEENVIAIGYVFYGGPEGDKHICKKVSAGRVIYSSAGQRGRGRGARRTTFGKTH